MRILHSLEVADYIHRRGRVDGVDDLTNMKLNKLVYIAHGWQLGYYRIPLVKGPLQPWPWGPVFPELYYWIKFNLIKAGKELDTAVQGEGFFFKEAGDLGNFKGLVDHVYGLYINLPAHKLVELTHVDGSPWHTARTNNWLSIPDETIEEYYGGRIKPHDS